MGGAAESVLDGVSQGGEGGERGGGERGGGGDAMGGIRRSVKGSGNGCVRGCVRMDVSERVVACYCTWTHKICTGRQVRCWASHGTAGSSAVAGCTFSCHERGLREGGVRGGCERVVRGGIL